MAAWQYSKTDRAPKLTTNEGYYVDAPKKGPGTPKADGKYTAFLSYFGDSSWVQHYLFLHEIEMSFQIGGSYAQSPRFKNFYARNFTQPTFVLRGQCASQAQYAELMEFIRQSQRKAIRASNVDTLGNHTLLSIHAGGPLNRPEFKRQEHYVSGHIKSVQRRTERFNFAPEYEIEFMVATASAGLFRLGNENVNETAYWMQVPMGMQAASQQRTPTSTPVKRAVDPDTALLKKNKDAEQAKNLENLGDPDADPPDGGDSSENDGTGQGT